jgi:hypothetical protein
MNLKEVLLFLTISIQIFFINSHGRCGSDKIKTKPTINTAVEKEKDLRFLQEKKWEPIKILVDYTFLDSQAGNIDKNMLDYAKRITEHTIKIFENIIMVQKYTSKILKVNENCDMIPLTKMNPDLTSKGLEGDIVIFPFFDEKAEELTEAYASPCSQHPTNFRPITGLMAFNPKNFKVNFKNAFEYYTLLVLHEINHILSFNSFLFDFFIDPITNAKIGKNNIIKEKVVNGIKRQMIVTPKVIQAAKKHFNCDLIDGLELENQGGDGSAGSHWEARLMLGDFMIAETYAENVLSEISLALMEDSGWYKINYYTGGLFRYGKNEGCNFLTKKCIENGVSRNPNVFAMTPNAQMCHASNLSKGISMMTEAKKDLDKNYQYFKNPKVGGYTWGDYCPVAQWDEDVPNEMWLSNSCALGKIHYQQLGETIDTSSSCFMSSLIPKDVKDFSTLQGKNRAICYPINCNKEKKTYTVKVLNTTVECPKEGGPVTDNNMDGTFYCVDYNKICTKAAPCKDALECALNKVEFQNSIYDYTPKVLNITYNSPALSAKDQSIPEPLPGNSNTDSGSPDVSPVQENNNSSSGNFVSYILLFLLFLII